MLYDGLNLIEGSSITNATVAHGASFPAVAGVGELFYRSDLSALYVYNGTAWTEASGETMLSISGDVSGTLSTLTGGSLTLSTVTTARSLGSPSSALSLTIDANGRVTASSASSIAIDAAQVLTGTFADARISQSSVTQHQAALSIAESQIPEGSLLARVGSNETITGSWSFTQAVSGVSPTLGSQFATKTYVDSAAQGWRPHAPAAVATTTNIALTGTQTIDGYAAQVGDRVLVKNQTSAAQNGVYVVSATTWTRASDFTTVSSGEFVFVTGGSQAGTGWTLATTGTITIDTTPLTFAQVSSSASGVTSISGSGGTTGLTLTGGPITNVGTLTLGGVLGIASGGTGQSSAAAALSALLPTQTGQAGKVLTTNGSSVSWGDGGSNITLTQGAQPNITSLGTLSSLTVSGAVSAGSFVGNGSSITGLSASNISTGTLSPARLGTGATSTTYLRGDGVWSGVDAASLTGTTLATNVVNSSLTQVGSLSSLTVAGSTTFGTAYTESSVTVAAAPFITINASLGNNFAIGLNQNVLGVTFTNVPSAGRVYYLNLFLTQVSGANTFTFPSSVTWAGNTPPLLATVPGKTDVITLVTVDGGTTWNGFAPSSNSAFNAESLLGASLATNITGSSLTSVGNITTGTWSGAFGAVSGANLTNLTAANITGILSPAHLGTGTANSTTFLRGDGSWQVVSTTPDASVLTGTTLASTVVNSSLTSVGNITTGTWSANLGAISGASLTNLTAANLTGVVPTANLGTGTANSTTYLRGDGTWSTVTALPSQTGASGLFLTTNGTTASWAAPSIAASTLTGTTLSSSVVSSSLTSVGTLGSLTVTGNVTAADPTANTHLATKSYVDNIVQGLSWKQSVKLATTTNITLSGTPTIDGNVAAVGQRVLVKDQTNGAENGVYVVASGAWTRAADFDGQPSVGEVIDATVFVQYGAVNGDTTWTQTANVVTVGVTPMQFVQINGGSGTSNAGSLTGTVLASNVVSSSLTSVGNITTGTWSANLGVISGANLTSLNASNLASGTVPTARLGSGSASASTVLTGASTYAGLTIGSSTLTPGTALTTIVGLTSITSGAFLGNASSATSIASGASNQILYQTAGGTTGFISAPVSPSTYLQWNGTSFTWQGVSVAANTLTGTSLASNVTVSALTTLGMLSSLNVSGYINSSSKTYIGGSTSALATLNVTKIGTSTGSDPVITIQGDSFGSKIEICNSTRGAQWYIGHYGSVNSSLSIATVGSISSNSGYIFGPTTEGLGFGTGGATRLFITSTGAFEFGGSSGSIGQVLTSNGPGAPTWQTPASGGGGASLTTANSWTATQTFAGASATPAVAFTRAYTEVQTTATLAATLALDATLGNHFTVPLGATAITAINFTNVPATGTNYNATLYVVQDGTGSRSIALNAIQVGGVAKTIKWSGGIVPTITPTANKTDIFNLVTYDGGNTWFGFIAGQNF